MANEEQLVKNVSSQFCRIFFDFVPNFLYELAKGIDYVSNSVQNRKLTSIKGEVFKNEKIEDIPGYFETLRTLF